MPRPGRPREPLPKLRFHPLDHAASAAIFSYAASATVTPICLVILARELSFSLTGGGGIEVVRSALVVTTLLASGFIGARWGKPLSLGASCLVLGLGMLVYSAAPTYGAVLLGIAFLGTGGGVVEGLLNPLVQDLHPRAFRLPSAEPRDLRAVLDLMRRGKLSLDGIISDVRAPEAAPETYAELAEPNAGLITVGFKWS